MAVAGKRRLRVGRLTALTGALVLGSTLLWAKVRATPVFRVEVVKLAACPNHLRPAASRVLNKLLHQPLFDVSGRKAQIVAELAKLPEVASARVACRPPKTVEVWVVPRVPVAAVRAGSRWLSVDSSGFIIRVGAKPQAGLVQVYGAEPALPQVGKEMSPAPLQRVKACQDACRLVLGAGPRSVALEPGGGLRARTASGDLVVLGQQENLERKLQVYQYVKNRLTEPVAYIDVSAPASPAVLPRG